MNKLFTNEEKLKKNSNKRKNKKRLFMEAYDDYNSNRILDNIYSVFNNNYDNNYDDNENDIVIDEIIPKNENQKIYIEYIKDKATPIVFSTGAAGTGKTFIAVIEALREVFVNKNYKKILITRPVVTCSEDIGYLPGSFQDKLDPYLKPLYDIFLKYISKKDLKYYLDKEIIEICPLGYIRGRTIENSFMIIDETQNCSIEQMKNLLTRIGKGSKFIITGDLKQSDLNKVNGLNDFINKYKNYSNNKEVNSIKIIEFEKKDVVRNKIIKTILNIYGDED